MYNTFREKCTGQFMKRETEDLYKLYFEIWKKKSALKAQTLWISLLLWLFKGASLLLFTMIYIYGLSLNLLNKRYLIIPFHVDIMFLGLKKQSQNRQTKKV